MKYRLFATDLDGTLLNNEGNLSKENRNALINAHQSGLKIVVASGRSAPTMRTVRRELGMISEDFYAITLNGGSILKGETPVCEHKLPKQTALATLKALRDLPEINKFIRIYLTAKESVIEYENDYTRYYHEKTGVIARVVERFEDEIADDIYKILILCGVEEVHRAAKLLELARPKNTNMFFSSKNLLEFTAEHATKGNALKFLAEKFSIDKSEIVAIGDSFNDISMLDFAGLSFAPKNADDEVKRHATIITTATNDENAVAEAINRVLTNNLG